MRAKAKSILSGLAVTAFWLAVWQLISRVVAQEILVPSPWQVAVTLWQMWGTALFWRSVGLSMLRVLGGFLAAVVVGTMLAVASSRFRPLYRLLSPLLHIVRAAPVASFIILAFVWIRVGILPAFISFLMVVPLVWANVSKGIAATDPQQLEMAQVFRLGWRKTFRQIRVPSVRPYFEAACTTGLGFAWKSGIAAEVISHPAFSIGKQLYTAKAYLETSEVFAWTVTVVLLSVLLERLLLRLVNSCRTREGVSV